VPRPPTRVVSHLNLYQPPLCQPYLLLAAGLASRLPPALPPVRRWPCNPPAAGPASRLPPALPPASRQPSTPPAAGPRTPPAAANSTSHRRPLELRSVPSRCSLELQPTGHAAAGTGAPTPASTSVHWSIGSGPPTPPSEAPVFGSQPSPTSA
jgi:hypothetical protein